MTHALSYVIFQSNAGWLGVVGSAKGLLRATLPMCSVGEVRQQLGDALDQSEQSPALFTDLVERLKAYFAGHRVNFPDRLDQSQATVFQRQVWEAARSIPYGETRSYAWVAGQIKRPVAVRAVGQALGKNPLPVIIPCHRVLASNGGLGGYSGGIETKKYLLRLESSGSA